MRAPVTRSSPPRGRESGQAKRSGKPARDNDRRCRRSSWSTPTKTATSGQRNLSEEAIAPRHPRTASMPYRTACEPIGRSNPARVGTADSVQKSGLQARVDEGVLEDAKKRGDDDQDEQCENDRVERR